MLKVFLVDDEYYERLSLKNNIPWAEHGMTVCGEANNGKTALQMMSADPPQIAVVDINMPGLSGLELIEQLNAQRIPCRYLILTGYDEFKYAQQAIHLGVFDYILKPINYQTLVQALDGLRKEIEQRDTLNNHLENLKNENERFYLERYYNDLVNCNFTIHNMKEYDQKLADDLLVSYGSYQIIVAEIPEKPSLEELRRFQGKLEEGLNKEDSFSCLDIKNRLFFIFDGGKETVYPRIIQTLLSLVKEKGYTVQVGAGNAYPGFEQMYLSYNEACIALENCAMLKQQIVFYRDIGTSWKYRGLDAKEKNGIKTLVFSRSMGELKQKLTDIYQVMGEERANRDQVILRTLELLNLLTEI